MHGVLRELLYDQKFTSVALFFLRKCFLHDAACDILERKRRRVVGKLHPERHFNDVCHSVSRHEIYSALVGAL